MSVFTRFVEFPVSSVTVINLCFAVEPRLWIKAELFHVRLGLSQDYMVANLAQEAEKVKTILVV